MSLFQTVIDSTTTPGSTYVCRAPLGAPTDKPLWSIIKIDAAGSTKYPLRNGIVSGEYLFSPSLKETYTYSYVNS